MSGAVPIAPRLCRPTSSRSLREARAVFLSRHPEYEETRGLDTLRAAEFARLDQQGHVYLDYGGSGLYAASQVRRHSELLLDRVLGNPHSINPASAESTRLVGRCRRRVLDYLHASGDEYAVIFTANASQAIKLVGEAYPWPPDGLLLLTADNHNSINGLREFARARGAHTLTVPMAPRDLRVDLATLHRSLDAATRGRNNLFAYPAQSNFSGACHPLTWAARARSRGWDVLLDAAAFVPTNLIDLSQAHPDFVVLSFYKMFGYPTGVGALIARHAALERLRRPWFAGGTIEMASVQADRFVRRPGAAAFEDGTVDFAAIPAVEAGIDLIESVSIETVHRRVRLLAGWLIDDLLALEHRNGRRLVRLYGPAANGDRGGTIALNFQDARGVVIDPRVVEEGAARRRISLRTGCFCNPGAGEAALELQREDLDRCLSRGQGAITYDDLVRCLAPRAAGAVRVSLGLVSNFADVWAFREYARTFLT